MPRNAGLHEYPPNTKAVPQDRISSANLNNRFADISNVLNSAWPENLGGTGFSSFSAALAGNNIVSTSGATFTGAITGTTLAMSGTIAASGNVSFGALMLVTGAATFNSSIAAASINITGATNLTTLTTTGVATFGAQTVINKDFVLTPVPLTSGASVAWDTSLGSNFRLVLGTNATLAAFTNGVPGKSGYLEIVQDATGGRTFDMSNAVYRFSGGQGELVSTGPNETTRFSYIINSAGSMELKRTYMSGRNSIGYFKEYDLGLVSALAFTVTTNHGLGRRPSMVVLSVECVVADADYAIGERIDIAGSGAIDSDSNAGLLTYSNATTVKTRKGTSNFRILNASGLTQGATPANWKLILRVYE